MMDERGVYAARDPYGLRPLSIGKLPNGYCVASETCALDIVGATFIRDVEPGELIRIDDRGPRSASFAESPRKALCIFEFVYLARADSRIQGTTVHEVRRKLGRRLAVEAPTQADMVIPVPDTGHSAAQGYAEVSGIPYGEGLMKNRYVGRTFIQPSQSLRERGVKLKLNPIPGALRGKRLVVIDDSIVRGITTRQVVQVLREAGAVEVHMRITSPPIKWPCFYGIDMSTRQELLASDLAVDEVRQFIGADSLAYLSLDALVEATGAEPLLFLDYIAVGKLIPAEVAELVRGVAEGCRLAGCALLGGETAEHPVVMEPGRFDLAGFCVGIVDEGDLLGPQRVEEGDVVIGLASSGPHANGFSLVRSAIVGHRLDEVPEGLGRPLADELLEPCAIYTPGVLSLS